MISQVQCQGCRAIAALPQLRRLEISQCQSLTDTAACELTRLTGLQELCLSNSSRVTDIALSTLVRAMPEMSILDLSGCHLHVSDVSMHAMADMSKLQVSLFSLSGMPAYHRASIAVPYTAHATFVGSKCLDHGASGRGHLGTTEYVLEFSRVIIEAARPLEPVPAIL